MKNSTKIWLRIAGILGVNHFEKKVENVRVRGEAGGSTIWRES